MDRRGLYGSIGVGLMAIGAASLGSKWLGLPEALVVGVFIVLFIVGGWLTLAAVSGLPPARPSIGDAHAAQLLEIARQGEGSYRTHQERQMFAAHYPAIAATRQHLEGAKTQEQETWDVLQAHLHASVLQRFPAADFWNNGSIYAKARHLLQLRIKPIELGEDDIRPVQVRVAGALDPPHLNWQDYVVWEDRGEAASYTELTKKARAIRDWLGEIEESEAARVYRDAVTKRRRLQDELSQRLEPILHHAPARWQRSCPIGRPKDA